MNLLLDTHTALWLLEGSPRLGRSARTACDVALAASELLLPSVVFYEVALLAQRGRRRGSSTVREWRTSVLGLGIREIAMSAEIAIRASELVGLHRDPFDRFIVATALVENATLMTADGPMLEWPGGVRRHDARR